MIQAVAATNPRTVVVVIGGSAILMEAWRDEVPAIVIGWYPGMEGGRALADVLTGAAEPGGRLPVAIPRRVEDLPSFDPRASTVTYDAWWGQRKLDRGRQASGIPLRIRPWIHDFRDGARRAHLGETDGSATVPSRIPGTRAGSTVVQIYAVNSDANRPVPQLVGFRRVELACGSECHRPRPARPHANRQRNNSTGVWSRRPGTWRIIAAPHSPQA